MRSSISASVVVLPAAIETWSYNSYRVKRYDRAMSVTAGKKFITATRYKYNNKYTTFKENKHLTFLNTIMKSINTINGQDMAGAADYKVIFSIIVTLK